MDFSNRNVQPQTTSPEASRAPVNNQGGNKRGGRSDNSKWGRIGVVLAVVVVAVLLIAATLLAVSSNGDNGHSQYKYVNTGKLQAVFLNTGQVYFGNLKTITDKYFVLTNIYYLQTASNGNSSSSSASNSSVTLVKLGCELHEPYDQMVINSSQVTFWENLQDNGQVAKAVKTFLQQNPSGKCTDQSSSASTNTGSSTQNAGSNSGSSAPATSTTPSKP